MSNNDKRESKKAVIFIIGIALIIAVLSIFAVFSASIMYWLGFEYESVGSFILYFIIGSFVSYPMNLIAGALPKALLKLKKNIKITCDISIYGFGYNSDLFRILPCRCFDEFRVIEQYFTSCFSIDFCRFRNQRYYRKNK